jgi:hypothetical protein
MVVTGDLKVFLLGCFGGAMAEVLHWFNLRTSDKLPLYVHSAFYWTVTVVMAMIGGALCWIQFGGRVEALTAVQVGLAAPIVLQKLVSATEPKGARALGGLPTLRDFFRW